MTTPPKRIRLQVASPCTESWDSMQGTEFVRYCGACQQNVYNFNEMTGEQIEELIANAQARLCARMFQRNDGTILTKDCSVGIRRKRKQRVLSAGGAGALAALSYAGLTYDNAGGAESVRKATTALSQTTEHDSSRGEGLVTMGDLLTRPAQVEQDGKQFLGDIASRSDKGGVNRTKGSHNRTNGNFISTRSEEQLGIPKVSAGLEVDAVRRHVLRKVAQLNSCYERAQQTEPSSQGTAIASFKITPEGLVKSVRVKGLGNQEVESCLANVFSSIQFPTPKNGKFVNVTNLRLTFRTRGR